MAADVVRRKVPRLDDIILNTISDDFAKNPVIDDVPESYVDSLIASLDLGKFKNNSQVLVNFLKRIRNEKFWEAMSRDRWETLQIDIHGSSWKRLFAEKHIQDTLEEFYYSKDSTCWNRLMESVHAVAPFVHTVIARQLTSHVEINKVLTHFPNLATLDLSYGAGEVGMNYDSSKFGMKSEDATYLAKYLKETKSLTRLSLTESKISDEIFGLVLGGLQINTTITCLDLQHNKISDKGAKRLASWIPKSMLMTINLSDNEIGAEGALHLALALADNTTVFELDIHLNQLEDKGGEVLVRNLLKNQTLNRLNVSVNQLGPSTGAALVEYVRSSRSLTHLDISCNNCMAIPEEEKSGESFAKAVSDNESLLVIDVRNTGISSTVAKAIHQSVQPRFIKDKQARRESYLDKSWEKQFTIPMAESLPKV